MISDLIIVMAWEPGQTITLIIKTTVLSDGQAPFCR